MNNNKIIIFRIDNIGDFLITTTLIDSVKKKFPDKAITIVCSERNFKIAKLYNSISNIIVYEKKYNFLKKIKIYYSILKNKYHASFAIDGKKFSILNTILMKSKFKFLIKYKKTKKILGINVERTKRTPVLLLFWLMIDGETTYKGSRSIDLISLILIKFFKKKSSD